MKQILQRAAIAASLLLLANFALADTAFSYRPAGNSDSYVTGTLTIKITGSIKEADYVEVMKADRLARAQILAQKGTGGRIVVFVELNSPGGRVETSLDMGRYLRSRNAIAMVKAGEKCFSSCVYLLAGAPLRSVDGSVGIHRPYDPNGTDATAAQQKVKYEKIGGEVVSYLKEMNIPTKLHEDSMFISPERLKILTSVELQAYGLNANDPYTEEANAVGQAKNLGISRRELANREARANLLCPRLSSPTAESTFDWVGCRNEVLNGNGATRYAASQIGTSTQRVDDAHPGWQQVVKEKEFAAWLSAQPEDIRRLSNSAAQEDAIKLLDLFKQRGITSESMIFLSCDLTWTVGNPTSFHEDFRVDLQNGKVNSGDAVITAESIVYRINVKDKPSITRISRRSGAISIYFEGLGSANGYCTKSNNAKF